MKSGKCFHGWILVFALVLVASPLVAEHHEGEHQEGEMSEEQMAMQEAWMEAMTPGEPHEWLASRAGSWSATVKVYWDPEGEPEVSEGTVERQMILGDRILKEQFEGSFQEQPFTGIGMTGYDNVTGRYWSTWVDNMSTGLYKSTGEKNDEGKLVMKGKAPDPMTGEMKHVKWVASYDGDQEIHEAWEKRGEEMVKTMEILYVRQ